MITQSFEIKVALLGYVSVGKTTVLNALLQDKYSEVSMRRTTAGVNLFRIVTPTPPSGKRSKASDAATDGTSDGKDLKITTTASTRMEEDEDEDLMVWAPLADEPTRTAPSTLEEITKDNMVLRKETSVVHEKTFNVELTKPLCDMRKDTTLVLVDIPGLNEAGSKKMYLNYVSKNWDTFDCVVMVMDAEKGVNTEEQVELLNLVKRNLEKTKKIPVLVLCNKVDDTEDEELMELVREVQTKVEEIFKVGNREASLGQLLTACRDGRRCSGDSVFPAFIPLSAGNAFAYRMAASCSLERFQELDLKLIDKIGRDEVGKNKWKKLSLDEKHKVVFAAVDDETQYLERLETTNFDKFLMALSYSVGGDDVQRELLEKQIEISLRKLTGTSSTHVVDELRSIYDKCTAIAQNPGHLKHAFWKVFEKIRKDAVARLKSDIDPTILAETFDQLINYGKFVRRVGWNDEESKIVKEMVSLVGQQIGVVCQNESTWKIDDAMISWYHWNNGSSRKAVHFPWDWERDGKGWRNLRDNEKRECEQNPALLVPTWKNLTYHDWCTVIGSLLLMANNMHFCERFGREKMRLERLLQRHTQYTNCMTAGTTTAETYALANIPVFMAGHYVDGQFAPADLRKYNIVVQIVAPELISDPSHWGHVIWKYCRFMDSVEKADP